MWRDLTWNEAPATRALKPALEEKSSEFTKVALATGLAVPWLRVGWEVFAAPAAAIANEQEAEVAISAISFLLPLLKLKFQSSTIELQETVHNSALEPHPARHGNEERVAERCQYRLRMTSLATSLANMCTRMGHNRSHLTVRLSTNLPTPCNLGRGDGGH